MARTLIGNIKGPKGDPGDIGVGSFLGEWDAQTNTPELTDGEGMPFDHYVVKGSETIRDFGNGQYYFKENDFVFYTGGTWRRLVGSANPAVEQQITRDAISAFLQNGWVLADTGITTSRITKYGKVTEVCLYVNGVDATSAVIGILPAATRPRMQTRVIAAGAPSDTNVTYPMIPIGVTPAGRLDVGSLDDFNSVMTGFSNKRIFIQMNFITEE